MTFRATACAKIILLGEHAVVYGRPAVAIPLAGLRAEAILSPAESGFRVSAPDIGLEAPLPDLPADHPLAFCVRNTAAFLGFELPPALLQIRSAIPVASGLGSGAAVSTAVVRLLALAAGRSLEPADVSALAFEVERIHHGTPSGIDNTVIAYEQPVYFVRGRPPETLTVGGTFAWRIADSGIPGETRAAVAGVRERHAVDPAGYERLFDDIGDLVEQGRRALENGNVAALGGILDACHEKLRRIGVSLPMLDRLAQSAREAGAAGAKLSGGGLGGNVIALLRNGSGAAVDTALRRAGAARVMEAVLEGGKTRSG